MSAGRAAVVRPSEREFEIVRVFAVARERVFRAWIEPELLCRWWGPHGFTNTFQRFEPRAGGHWEFVMRSPTGEEYANHSVFVEVREPERIVFDHLSTHWFRLTAAFEPHERGSRLAFRMGFESAAECERVMAFAAEANEQNLDRLEALLTTEACAAAGRRRLSGLPAPRVEWSADRLQQGRNRPCRPGSGRPRAQAAVTRRPPPYCGVP